MTDQSPAGLPFDHNIPSFDTLVDEAASEFAAYREGIEKPTERLYRALELAYRIQVIGESRPKDFDAYAASKLGKLTKATRKSPFMVALRLVFGSDQEQSPDRARYSKALSAVRGQLKDDGLEDGAVVACIKASGKIDGLVKAAKEQERNVSIERRKKEKKDELGGQLVLENEPKATLDGFAASGESGFRLVLGHINDEGMLSIFAESTTAGVEAFLRRLYDQHEKARPKPIYLAHRLEWLIKAGSMIPAKKKTLTVMNDNGAGLAAIRSSDGNGPGVEARLPEIAGLDQGKSLTIVAKAIRLIRNYLGQSGEFSEQTVAISGTEIVCQLADSPLVIAAGAGQGFVPFGATTIRSEHCGDGVAALLAQWGKNAKKCALTFDPTGACVRIKDGANEAASVYISQGQTSSNDGATLFAEVQLPWLRDAFRTVERAGLPPPVVSITEDQHVVVSADNGEMGLRIYTKLDRPPQTTPAAPPTTDYVIVVTAKSYAAAHAFYTANFTGRSSVYKRIAFAPLIKAMQSLGIETEGKQKKHFIVHHSDEPIDQVWLFRLTSIVSENPDCRFFSIYPMNAAFIARRFQGALQISDAERHALCVAAIKDIKHTP